MILFCVSGFRHFPRWATGVFFLLFAAGVFFPLAGRAEVAGPAGANPYVHELGADGSLRLELVERIKHPHFWWPRTLLNYRVMFKPALSAPERWRLADADGKPVPFQISDVRTADGTAVATLSFFSDLPSGGRRSFDLRTVAAGTAAAPAAPAAVAIREEADGLILDTGTIKVRVPASRKIRQDAEAPGPILAVADAKGWMGKSKFLSLRKPVRKITTEILDRGPLFARVRISYDLAGNASYVATITASLGYDFVEVFEQIDGLGKEEGASVEMAWTGIALDQRRGQDRIDQPKPLFFRGEDPFFTGPARIENPAEDFYFRLAHTAADNTINLPSVDFTDSKHSRSIGLAVLDGAKWDDREYAIWASNDTLAVRFRHPDGVLRWQWPLANGTRSLAVAAYDPATAGQEDGAAFQRWRRTTSEAAVANTGVSPAKSRIAFINSRYGGMGLDVVKDWRLDYPETARRPAPAEIANNAGKEMKGLPAYMGSLWGDNCELLKAEGNWISPVSLRIMSAWVVPGFNKWRAQMTSEERERATALILFHAYFAAREEISPMRHVLKGHPNFMADWKYPLMAGPFLFPEHPLAKEWADQFEKLLETMGVFYVRPPVQSWEAKGGRWTESLGVYNWAFIQPALHANELGIRFDGRDRWPNPGLALHGDYLAGIVSAPVKLGSDGIPLKVVPGAELVRENGFQRLHPPQGAHAGRRAIPTAAEDFGQSLRRYHPLVGEYLLWASQRPPSRPTDAEGHPVSARPPQTNFGTNPRLASGKYTGYGIVMRAAVDTPEEISVFVQQIDKGPNYRWGFGNEGGCGDIYYYAGGKSYAGHFGEDAGDRRVTDAEVTCNTGVYKNYTFRGIGMNELTEPFYNLECAQFAELLPRQGADAYSWPEYGSRAVLLVGSDYIITFDVVNGMSRLSWNTVKGQDEMPKLIPIRGETAFRTTQTSVGGHGEVTESQRFEPYKGGGDRMALVSHRQDVKVKKAVLANATAEVTEVRTPAGTDLIFLNRNDFTVADDYCEFSGRAGVIRRLAGGRTELALFHGASIGLVDLIQLDVDNPDLGISAAFSKPEEAAGRFFSRRGGTLSLTLNHAELATAARLYVDGQELAVQRKGSKIVAKLPAGDHRWQLTAGSVEPMPPQILRSEAVADGARLFIAPVASAQKYRIERSDDNGRTWQAAGETAVPEFMLSGIKAPAKLHVRAVALNQGKPGRPGRDYPVYVTGRVPEEPVGLKLVLGNGEVKAIWGEMLGVKEFVLYRRQKGETKWNEVYRGREPAFADKVRGMMPAFAEPGLESAAARQPGAPPVVHEYAVTAVDGVGEGGFSFVADTDPASWRNWQPPVPLVYKRQSAYWLPPYVRPEQVPPPGYPQ